MSSRVEARCLVQELRCYREQEGVYPTSDAARTWYMKMVDAGIAYEDRTYSEVVDGLPLDSWGRPFVYIPPSNLAQPVDATFGGPIVRSVGENGIDDGGAGDDLTPGVPTRDGYYGYRYRPLMWKLIYSFAAVMILMAIATIRLSGARLFMLVVMSLWAATCGVVCIPLHYTGFGLGGYHGGVWDVLYAVSILWLPVGLAMIALLFFLRRRKMTLPVAA